MATRLRADPQYLSDAEFNALLGSDSSSPAQARPAQSADGSVRRRADGSTYAVLNEQFTNQTPTELLNEGLEYDPETDRWFKVIGRADFNQMGVNILSEDEIAQRIEQERVREAELGTLRSDPLSAFASSATEQIPFLDEAAAGVTGLVTGTPYEEVRSLQRDLQQYDRQNQPLARNVGGVAGAATGLAAPGGSIGQGIGRSIGVGAGYGALYGAGAGEDSYSSRLQGALQGGALGGATAGALQGGLNYAQRLSSIARPPQAARAPSALQERVADFDRVGVDPVLAGVGGPNTQRLAQTLGGNLVTSGPINRAAQAARTQTSEAVDRVAGQYGETVGRDAAGRAISGAAESAANRLRQEGGELYAPINALEQNANPISLTNSAQSIQNSLSIFQTPELRDWFSRNATDLTQFRDVLSRANNEVTFAEARQLRSIVGNMLNDPQVFNSRSQSGLRSLYGALSDDIAEGARTLGGEEAASALSRADSFYSASRNRADNLLRQFYQGRAGRDVTDAEAYNLLLSAAKTRGNRSSSNTVRQFRDSVTPDEWNDIGAGVIRTLGGEGDQFSIARFASAYEELTPEARRILFGGSGREEQFADLNALARVARQQERAGRFYNSSESGNVAGNFSALGAVSYAAQRAAQGDLIPLATVAGTALAGRLTAELLTRPGVARLFAGSTRNAVRDAERLARRDAVFSDWWNANRNAVVQAIADNDNLPSILPAQSVAQEEQQQ